MSSFAELSELAQVRLAPELDSLHQQLKYLALNGPSAEAKEDFVIRNVEIRARIYAFERAIELLLTPPASADAQPEA